MKKMMVVFALALGSLAAAGDGAYEVQLKKSEAEAVRSVNRRGQEVDERRRLLEAELAAVRADAAAITSEIRGTYHIGPDARLELIEGDRMRVVPAPIATTTRG